MPSFSDLIASVYAGFGGFWAVKGLTGFGG
jgi:hypothetical protein